ncbi:hypothetical protein [Nitrosopumilus sp.]|uniref:hypothetical protein n=1 Tax=Nitrosopumilus sp. TaxID=2024843 RepID=UPI00247E5FE6|nr:hypothetical protein [Nitrosopumilus sp.]MCV0431862.1 hypothetical protein [Nitrosopumilus sp.]
MRLICLHCSKVFEGEKAKFCSQVCRDSFIVNIAKRTREAVRDDPSHTRELSKDF